MPTVLITGSSGLIGSACVRHFSVLGWEVFGLDNNARAGFFGPDGDTTATKRRLRDKYGFVSWPTDIRDVGTVNQIVNSVKPNLVIHAAAQPSHDYAAAHPFEDFETNARGTLNLLEAVRQHAPEAVFVFLSTNKVYGDAPNSMALEELPTRYELTGMGNFTRAGFDETLPIDQSLHSLFGCSKAAADLYTQEYGRNFGMKTVCLRCGCLTGSAHAGAEQHGFLAYLAKCCREGRKYRVFGYEGRQVRDNLHSMDIATACHEFYKNPRAGEVYNLGGGRANSISILEAIAEIEKRVGKRMDWEYLDSPRKGDHIVWLTDYSKFQSHYPGWQVRVSLPEILDEICG